MMKYWKMNIVGLSLLIFGLFSPLSAQIETGVASYYSDQYHLNPDSKTASGELYDRNQLTAAHRTLPFNTYVRVVNLDNGREVTVRINDRGPYADGRVIDLSRAAAEQINLINMGTAPVRIEPVAASADRGQAPGADRRVTVDFPTTASTPEPKRGNLAGLPIVDGMGRPVGSTSTAPATSTVTNPNNRTSQANQRVMSPVSVPTDRGYNANARVSSPQIQPTTNQSVINATRRTGNVVVTDPTTFIYNRQEADVRSSVPLPPTASEVRGTGTVPTPTPTQTSAPAPTTNATQRVARSQSTPVYQSSINANRRLISPPPSTAQAPSNTPLIFSMIAQPQSTTSSGYGVQVGAFFDWKRLHMALGEINNKGIPNTMVQIGEKDGKEIFRILIGPYGSKAEADRMRSQLANKGVKGLSVSLSSLK